MNIRLNIGTQVTLSLVRPPIGHERQVVVNDHVHLQDIDTSGNDVRRNQDLHR